MESLSDTRLDTLVVKKIFFSCPLDHANPTAGPKITLFARFLASRTRANHKAGPYLLFLQGGPGYEAMRPHSPSGWMTKAIALGYHVILLDQRGTGLSTLVTHQTLARFKSPEEQAQYLTHFRADAIVFDCEILRKQFTEQAGKEIKWTLLGQSYGGFIITSYLSLAPEGIEMAFMCGGLPPLVNDPDEVYRHTFKRVIQQNKLYYEKYPEDVEKVREIVDYLSKHQVKLPQGGLLTVRRFLQLGIRFGFEFETLHYLLESAFVEGQNGKELNYLFLRTIHADHLGFEKNPIYAILHEAIYCQGHPSNWSAERIQSEFKEFQITPDKPVYFTGEMVYSWMFDDYFDLQPLKAAAQILAQKQDWPKLYDIDKLNSNTIPVAAIAYYEDMYVELALSQKTANQIKGIKIWVTNEYNHRGLSLDGNRILQRLYSLVQNDL